MFLLNQVKGALQREFDDFAAYALAPGAIDSISAAAICIARRHIKHSVFEVLNRRLLECHPGPSHRWHGLRVMAVDSSILNLPATAELYKHFGGQVQHDRRLPMARLSQLLDVDTGLSWHAIVSPLALNERVVATDHLEHAPADALVLYDRGYASLFLMAWHRQFQRDFCMRLPRGYQCAAALMASANAPTLVQLLPSRAARMDCREHSVSTEPLAIRLIRVVLSTGEVEILATTLTDPTAYPDADFKALYAQRWNIEGDFRIQKSRLQMENFSGKRTHVIYQDVHAKILTKNLTCWLISIAQARRDQADDRSGVRQPSTGKPIPAVSRLPHRQRINLTDALHVCKNALIRVLLGSGDVLEPLLARMQRYTHCERKNRPASRRDRHSKAAVRFPMAYKQTG